jgi:hypothetical protein
MVEAGKQFRRVTATSTYAPCETHRNRSPNLSLPPAMMRKIKPPDNHRAATKIPRNLGHPRSGLQHWEVRVLDDGANSADPPGEHEDLDGTVNLLGLPGAQLAGTAWST